MRSWESRPTCGCLHAISKYCAKVPSHESSRSRSRYSSSRFTRSMVHPLCSMNRWWCGKFIQDSLMTPPCTDVSTSDSRETHYFRPGYEAAVPILMRMHLSTSHHSPCSTLKLL